MAKPMPEPISLDKQQAGDIAEKMATCPFVGTAVATAQLPVRNSAKNPLAAIDDIAELGDRGGGDLGRFVLKLFARGNHSEWVVPVDGEDALVPDGMFSLVFGGSKGAHYGHSGILLGDPEEDGLGRFDQAAFDRLADFADDEGRLSVDSVGDFIADNLTRDHEKVNVLNAWALARATGRLVDECLDVLSGGDETERTQALSAFTQLLGTDNLAGSAGEWGLLFAFLAESPNSKSGRISLLDVRTMFVDKHFPDGWESWPKRTHVWIRVTLRLTMDALAAYHFGLR